MSWNPAIEALSVARARDLGGFEVRLILGRAGDGMIIHHTGVPAP